MKKIIAIKGKDLIGVLTIGLFFFLSIAPLASASLSKKVIADLAYWDQVRGFQDIQQNVDVISEVSPNWYSLNAQGDIIPFRKADGTTYVDTSIVSYLKTNNILIVPMIQNIVGGDWNSAAVSTILNDPALTEKHISNIVNLVMTAEYDGIDIDYESLAATDRTAFSNFIRDLATALHANNKILSVNVHPKSHEPGYWNGPQSQDWSLIGSVADEVRIMLYGYSWQTSVPGPIAPISWVNEVMAFAVSVIPAQKIIQGVPTYGLDWPQGSIGTEYVWDQFVSLAATYSSVFSWGNVSKSPWFQYITGGIQHTAWFENASSTTVKLDSTNQYGAAGIFIWRLGGEDGGIWNVIRSKFGGVITPPLPTASIKAGGQDTEITIVYNTSTVISWISANADSCSVSPSDWTGVSNSGISTGNIMTKTTYTLTCTGQGGVVSDSVVVNVTTPPPTSDVIPPVVSINEPTGGSVVSRRVQISVSATDNVRVTKVLIYVDGKLLSTDTSAPYVDFWNTQKVSAGSHTIKAVAYDAAGNFSTAQVSVTVK